MNSTEQRNNRIFALDNIKGILIILVVFAHILKNKAEADPIVIGIYFFHMPAFIFLSGYFSKGKRSRGGQPCTIACNVFAV